MVERALPFAEANSCAAFATESDGAERLALVVEASREMVRLARAAARKDNGSVETEGPESAAALDELVERLRGAVTAEFEIPLHAVLFIRPGTFPRTSSGKVQRRACRDGFQAGNLEVVHQWQDQVEETVASPNASLRTGESLYEQTALSFRAGERETIKRSSRTDSETSRSGTSAVARLNRTPPAEQPRLLEEWLQRQVQEVAGLTVPPRPDKGFFELGIDSLKAVELTSRLQR